MQIRPYQASDLAQVLALWRACNLTIAANDPRKDIERKLAVSPEQFLLGEFEGKVVASVMTGYEGHRGWINYLAVAPSHRRKSYGRLMMAAAEQLLDELGCPKINLQVRSANASVVAFYASLGYVIDDVVSMGKRLRLD
ncbi:MAG: GNAT family acetyltransferase [Gammaproteobacteria bacterium]|jgi:ribosomal protein S18 acetylase RimI-like enzyme|nr:GNAT family acetyltransferase [Gammaproteobacteria bacterium]MDA8868946.1 GNAT family acetyltransferase [Pseudomonadales bacterium]MBT5332397.1 GNAT family acetyltransferase [Gammaproteobacteria bacterium]MBT5680997.1 GNAT family acetyltransferase [Gammaproteobacteria bacterium]MBT6024789.1 GNAT family acetyltransferase [Gammaproteobacteria bacterium]